MDVHTLWYTLLAWFGDHWSRNYGEKPSPLVRAELDAMTDAQRLTIAAGCRQWTGSFPPTIPQLLQLADDRPNDHAVIGMALAGDDSHPAAAALMATMPSWDRQNWSVDRQRQHYREQLEVLKYAEQQSRTMALQMLLERFGHDQPQRGRVQRLSRT